MRNAKKKRKVAAGALSAVLAAALSLTAVPFSAFAAETSDTREEISLLPGDAAEGDTPMYVEQHTYSDYYDVYCGGNRPDVEIMMPGAEYDSTEGGSFSVGAYGTEEDTRDNVLIWDSS